MHIIQYMHCSVSTATVEALLSVFFKFFADIEHLTLLLGRRFLRPSLFLTFRVVLKEFYVVQAELLDRPSFIQNLDQLFIGDLNKSWFQWFDELVVWVLHI